MKTIKTRVLIIGGGAAGLNAALNLKDDVILVEKPGSCSLLSPWNIMIKPLAKLKREMIETGNYMNDINLVNVFIRNYKTAIKNIKSLGIKMRKSNIGIVPDYPNPGVEVRKIFLEKLCEKQISIIQTEVNRFIVDENNEVRGVVTNDKKIFFDYLVLASGGLGKFFVFRTGYENGTITSLCYEAGFKIRDVEFFMFHPFFIVDKRFPRTLVSGEFVTKLEFVNENNKQFLSHDTRNAIKTDNYRYIFPQITREFYLQCLKGKIYGRLTCSEKWFEQFKKENEFGIIFNGMTKDIIKKIEFHPAFHYSIGGLVINEHGMTTKKNVYAAGEIVGGLHGANRIGGLAIMEALVFSKIVAKEINKSTEELPIPKRMKILGKIGISKSIKNKVWEALGPVKTKDKLKKLYTMLRKPLTSDEKFLKKIVEICLLRKESVGSFYVTSLPQAEHGEPSFLIKDKITFGA